MKLLKDRWLPLRVRHPPASLNSVSGRAWFAFGAWAAILLSAVASPVAGAGDAAESRAPLTAGELLLVVNRNEPAGVELARYYAERRGVPGGRMVALDLPPADELSLDEYEQRIAEPLLAALRAAESPGADGVTAPVRCIVTFYGVPFRIGPRAKDAATLAELRLIAEHRRVAQAAVATFADRAEALARQVDAGYRPPEGAASPEARLSAAAQHAAARVPQLPDAGRRAELDSAWQALWTDILRPMELPESPPAASAPGTAPAIPVALPTTPGGLNFGSSEARRALRAEVRRTGPVRYDQLLAIQADFLSFDQTDAAVDSELATLRWGPHVRVKWQGNPLHYQSRSPGGGSTSRGAVEGSQGVPPTTMVMRLDGPSPEVVRRMIDDAIAVETAATGLVGRAVLDSWAKPARKPDGSPDGYGAYDESIRRLERVLAGSAGTKSGRLPLVFEASEQLVPENSQRDIAIYCGWYDPNRVSLPGSFARGAVGFHVASYTAVGLRGAGGGWWTPALLSAGVCATIGPVSEPYLSAFPPADDFFPLLLTGRLTLAEVYWATTPMVSWKMLAIGDPLYRPFAAQPALSVDELPPALRGALSDR